MRVTLVFPPSLCLPNPIYYSLPLLAGALTRAGHQHHTVDLNVLAADLFLTQQWAERLLGQARAIIQAQGGPGRDRTTSLEDLVRERKPKILDGPASKETLRDPVRNFDPAAFRHAFSTAIDLLERHLPFALDHQSDLARLEFYTGAWCLCSRLRESEHRNARLHLPALQTESGSGACDVAARASWFEREATERATALDVRHGNRYRQERLEAFRERLRSPARRAPRPAVGGGES